MPSELLARACFALAAADSQACLEVSSGATASTAEIEAIAALYGAEITRFAIAVREKYRVEQKCAARISAAINARGAP
jgi:hypothetical protein